MQKSHIFLCIDLKSFYASVECVERGLNSLTTDLVVADETRGKGALCLAVSSSLKKKGVKNRCRLFEIPQELSYLIAKPRMKKYIEYSADIYSLYLRYIAKEDIHVYSIDECFLDITSYLLSLSENTDGNGGIFDESYLERKRNSRYRRYWNEYVFSKSCFRYCR